MMKLAIMKKASNLLVKAKHKTIKHAPELLIAGGIASSVGGVIVACRATIKANEFLEEKNKDVAKIEHSLEMKDERYTEEDAENDRRIVKIQTVVGIIKIYAPAVALEVVSLACFLSSHNVMKKRNAALTVAYTTLSKAFDGYRKRVAERYGEDVEREIRYDLKAKKFESTEKDPETGKEKKKKETVKVGNGKMPSEFACFFDEASREWSRDANQNFMFLRAQQRYANEKLRVRSTESKDGKGYMFLNEVREALGLDPTREGQIFGWIYDPDDSVPLNDNYIDFGIYDYHSEAKRDFLDGYERNILLDFNVYGPIIDLI